ncbi:hypothetical protein KM043_000688 [Ampulex compressa]|nr:hypothetical protein KM043_000688 [Ampulex compressa]
MNKKSLEEMSPVAPISYQDSKIFCPKRYFFKMGKVFGNLAKVNGIVFFRLSPYEQKAFSGMFTEGIPNLIRRFRSQVLRISPFIAFTYTLYRWGEETNHKLARKNPKDYINDT